MSSDIYEVSTGWVLGKISSLKERCCSGTAAQGGGGVTVPGGVPEPCGCGTEDVVSGHGGGGLAVGPADLRAIFQPS